MKTILAYAFSILGSLIAVPLIFIFLNLFFFGYIKKNNTDLLYWLRAIISTIITCFIVVFLSTFIFHWLNV